MCWCMIKNDVLQPFYVVMAVQLSTEVTSVSLMSAKAVLCATAAACTELHCYQV